MISGWIAKFPTQSGEIRRYKSMNVSCYIANIPHLVTFLARITNGGCLVNIYCVNQGLAISYQMGHLSHGDHICRRLTDLIMMTFKQIRAGHAMKREKEE